MPDAQSIRLLLADVDGTLVTQDKLLTDAAVDAVHELRRRRVRFAITSGRPPRGMSMLIEPLAIETPIAGFNGGVMVDPDMSVLEQHTLSDDLVIPIAGLMDSFHLDVWLYRGADWYVRDPKAPHVEREAWTVKFEPRVMDGLDGLTTDVAKLVGVSDDHEAVARAASATKDRFGDSVAAAPSQPYYLDVTHPDANKGEVVRHLATRYHLRSDAIATIGDMPNDVLMFQQSGLSIAMGNGEPEVQGAAHVVTDSNEEEGFAKAVHRFLLGEEGWEPPPAA